MKRPPAAAALPTVAIVGRPNVGKSALFNRMAGRKIAIVHDQPGITRDRLVTECKMGKGAPFEIVDTGGIGTDVDGDFSARVHVEAEIALAAADVVLFVVDGRAGLTPIDAELARRLRRAEKTVLLVVNKLDEEKHAPLEGEFTRLGFPEVHAVSAEHGRGVAELVSAVRELLPPREEPVADPAAVEPAQVPRLAIVGRPNVGKSSLTNAILGGNRTIVSETAGTTRDAVDIRCTFEGRPYTLIDTAGIRPRGRRDNSAEIFSVMRSEESIKRADLCVLVIDASAGVTQQDRQIAGLVQKANKPCIVAVNKWDLLVPEDDSRTGVREHREQWLETAKAELFFLPYVSMATVSALKNKQVVRLFKNIEETREAANRKMGTGPLNRFFQAAMEQRPPPLTQNKRFKVLYATQIKGSFGAIPAPSFLLFVNDPALLTPTYRKYLEARMREAFPFPGLPILFKMRGREPKERDKR